MKNFLDNFFFSGKDLDSKQLNETLLHLHNKQFIISSLYFKTYRDIKRNLLKQGRGGL